MINPLSLVAPACGLVALAHWHPGVRHQHGQEAAVQARRCPTRHQISCSHSSRQHPHTDKDTNTGQSHTHETAVDCGCPCQCCMTPRAKCTPMHARRKKVGRRQSAHMSVTSMPYPLPQGLPALHDQSSLRLQPCTRARVLRLCHRHRLLRCYRDIIIPGGGGRLRGCLYNIVDFHTLIYA